MEIKSSKLCGILVEEKLDKEIENINIDEDIQYDNDCNFTKMQKN